MVLVNGSACRVPVIKNVSVLTKNYLPELGNLQPSVSVRYIVIIVVEY